MRIVSTNPTRRTLFGNGPSSRDQGREVCVTAPTRLAVEMALHEENERRVLAGELVRLEHAWVTEEELASISDNLLLPDSTDEKLSDLRARSA